MTVKSEGIDQPWKQSRLYDFNYLLLVMMVVLFIPVFFMPMINAPDTESYLALSSQRPPLFSLVLRLDHVLTGGLFLLTRLLQMGLMVWALLYLDKWLRRSMQVPGYATLILSFLFLMPLIYHGHFGRLLLSEALSIPLYIFALVYLCKLFINPQIKVAIGFSVCVSLLILTRNQFYFLYGFFVLALVWCAYRRVGRANFLLLGATFIFAMAATTVASMGYHKIMNGKFANTSANGPLLFVQPFFLAKRSDQQYFKNHDERQAFLAAYDHAEKKGYLQGSTIEVHQGFSLGWDNLPKYVHFVDVFDPIQFESSGAIAQFYPTNYSIDKVMTHMAWVLFLHNLKQNLIFYSWKFSYSLGGPLLLVVFILLALISLVALLRNRESDIAIVTGVLLCLVFANNLIIAIAEMVLTRYLIYPSLALSVLVLVLFAKAMSRKPL